MFVLRPVEVMMPLLSADVIPCIGQLSADCMDQWVRSTVNEQRGELMILTPSQQAVH